MAGADVCLFQRNRGYTGSSVATGRFTEAWQGSVEEADEACLKRKGNGSSSGLVKPTSPRGRNPKIKSGYRHRGLRVRLTPWTVKCKLLKSLKMTLRLEIGLSCPVVVVIDVTAWISVHKHYGANLCGRGWKKGVGFVCTWCHFFPLLLYYHHLANGLTFLPHNVEAENFSDYYIKKYVSPRHIDRMNLNLLCRPVKSKYRLACMNQLSVLTSCGILTLLKKCGNRKYQMFNNCKLCHSVLYNSHSQQSLFP